MDLANAYPNEVEAHWSGSAVYPPPGNIRPWNPLSDELRDEANDIKRIEAQQHPHDNTTAAAGHPHHPTSHHSGYLHSIMHNNAPGVNNYWIHYKYAVILIGSGTLASADRLGKLLAHSGCVLLIQSPHKFIYSFSSQLRPWVHYVPLSYRTTDLVDKVRWLRSLARQIVANAQAFGRSYLRLEDHYCYVLTMLEELGGLCEHSDVLEPFHPIDQLLDLSDLTRLRRD